MLYHYHVEIDYLVVEPVESVQCVQVVYRDFNAEDSDHVFDTSILWNKSIVLP